MQISLVLQIPDAVLPGDVFTMPTFRYYEGMIISGGGAYELYRDSAFTLGSFVVGPSQMMTRPHWIHHEALGHGNQEQYGWLYIPAWLVAWSSSTISYWWAGASISEGLVAGRKHNLFEDQANKYMTDALLNGTPPYVP